MNIEHKLAIPLSIKRGCSSSSEVLFISECSPWGKLGYETVLAAFRSVQPVFWSPGLPKPDLNNWQGDWIISFKSDLILSLHLIERAKKGALNFHPSPPKYRGVGGYWWALHNGDDTFGVTCHHMDERIDHGAIIKTETFPIWPEEDVERLKQRTAIHSLSLLNETLQTILNGKPLSPSRVKWGDHLYTYKELALAQSRSATNHDHSVTQPHEVNPFLRALEAIITDQVVLEEPQEFKRHATNIR